MTRIDGARVHRPRSIRLEVSGQMSGRARLSIKARPFKLRQYEEAWHASRRVSTLPEAHRGSMV